MSISLFVNRNVCTVIFLPIKNLQDYYETYVYALVQEIDLWVSEHPESKERSIDTIYFGGGRLLNYQFNNYR